jgi:hypothetical protein
MPNTPSGSSLPLGVVQPRHAAGRQEGGQHRVEQQVDLADRDAEQRRQHQPEDAPHSLVPDVEARPRQHADAGHERCLEHELDDPRQQHRPGQREHRLRDVPRADQRARDQRQVEEHRREGRYGETRVAVQHRAGETGHRDEEQVGEGDADQLAGQLQLGRNLRKARREHQRDHRRSEHHQRGHGEQPRAEHPRDRIDQRLDLALRARGAVLGEHRHEGLREGALGEQPAQELRDAKRDVESVGIGGRAEQRGQHHVPHQPCDARDHGHAAHGQAGAQ